MLPVGTADFSAQYNLILRERGAGAQDLSKAWIKRYVSRVLERSDLEDLPGPIQGRVKELSQLRLERTTYKDKRRAHEQSLATWSKVMVAVSASGLVVGVIAALQPILYPEAPVLSAVGSCWSPMLMASITSTWQHYQNGSAQQLGKVDCKLKKANVDNRMALVIAELEPLLQAYDAKVAG